MYKYLFIVVLVVFFLYSPIVIFAAKDDWKAIEPAHLALKAPLVEKDADAEAIFWEVRVQDQDDGFGVRTVLNHYLRIKVFTERGRDEQSKIDIPYFGDYKIKDIAGRTIKPDGSIVELKKDAIFDRTIINSRGIKIKAKSFAMPAVEPGVIIEYRWKEIRDGEISFYVHLDFQRDIPVQEVKYFIKPYSAPGFSYGMRLRNFNCPSLPLNKEKDGFSSTTLNNVPAFREEPYMPPEDSIRPWILVYYIEDKESSPDIFWQNYGKEVFENVKEFTKVNDDVRKSLSNIISPSDSPKDKVDKIFEFCRTKIRNSRYVELTENEKNKVKNSRSPAETLKIGAGTSGDILYLFAAMANAAGFDSRIARSANREKIFFNRNFTNPFFMRGTLVAVQIEGQWVFYDPANIYLPKGMLDWREEGQETLISDSKQPFFVKTNLSDVDKSLVKRTAKLRINEEGNLEGDIKVEYTGHFDLEYKDSYDKDSPNEEENILKESIKGRLPNAEISNVKIENFDVVGKPYTYSYQIKVPGYCQKTGKRLFLQPSYFQNGVEAMFSASERKHPIYFNFPWSEVDSVSINLPQGYELENPSVPPPLTIPDIGGFKVRIQISEDKKVLFFTRNFSFGTGGALYYPQNNYAQVKGIFNTIQERDKHTLTLKQKPVEAEPAKEPAKEPITEKQQF